MSHLSKPDRLAPGYSRGGGVDVMRERVAVLGVVAVLAASARLRPRGSGRTFRARGSRRRTRRPRAGRPAPQVFGPQFTIAHQDPALTLTRTFNGTPATIRYVLDGSEVTSRMPGRLCEAGLGGDVDGGVGRRRRSRSRWSARVPPNGKTVKMDVKSTLRLESPDTLRVEMTARVRGPGGAPHDDHCLQAHRPARRACRRANAEGASHDGAGGLDLRRVDRHDGQLDASKSAGRRRRGGSMLAVSRTLRDGLMSAFEFLCIVERDGGLVYTAMPNGRTPATDFTLTKIDDSSATFENPAHDFPKMIRYTKRPDGSLEAVISGEGGQKPQTFVFKRQ